MTNLKIERDGGVVTVRLHRPHVLNALSGDLLAELLDALRPLDTDPEVGCFVVTGSATRKPKRPSESARISSGDGGALSRPASATNTTLNSRPFAA